MAFRGRGRGRGYGGGGAVRNAKQEPFILFPDIENFPDAKTVVEDIPLVVRNSQLQKFWNSSPYYIVDGKATNLSTFIKMSGEYVPAELAKVSDSKKERRNQKNVLWNPKSEMLRLDFFEKLEQKNQGQDEKSGKEKKEDENEEEDDENLEEEDEEFSDDGDYNQNIDFDDDEDDFNMDDGNDDEPIY